jgi:hypothetical protein
MLQLATLSEVSATRRVFEAWSIEVPIFFVETFVEEGSYWHAYDENRSVSLTSIVVTDMGRPVKAELLAGQIPPLDGERVEDMPPGVMGCAAIAAADESSRAMQALSGILAVEGRILIVTVTSDDLEWARQVWLSIRYHGRSASFRPTQRRRMGHRAVH